MTNNKCLIFKYSGKYAHFLRAEANASAPSYPFPPRTALMGMLGAVMGLEKDTCQTQLKDAGLAVSGGADTSHWHKANLRKDPPGLLPVTVKKKDKGSSKNQRTTQIIQEWLFRPCFTVYAQLPEAFHTDLYNRLKNRTWHFSPCLGLSEMTADLEYLDCVETRALPPGKYEIATVVRQDSIILDTKAFLERNTAAKSIRMPRSLTPDRQFQHTAYVYEARGNPIPVKTASAIQTGGIVIQWL